MQTAVSPTRRLHQNVANHIRDLYRCFKFILSVKKSMPVLRLLKITELIALAAINKICIRGDACNSACDRSSADRSSSVLCV